MKFVYSLMEKGSSDVVNGIIETENKEIAELAITKYLKNNHDKFEMVYLSPIDSSIDYDFIAKAEKEYVELHYKKFYVTFVEGGYGTYRGKDIIHALQRCCPTTSINKIKSWEEVV